MKFVEEILELNKELLKKNFSGADNRKAIIEEIADVGIMFDQMFLILDMDIPTGGDVRNAEYVFSERYKELKNDNSDVIRYAEAVSGSIEELAFIQISLRLVTLDKPEFYEEIGFARYCFQILEDKYQGSEEVFTVRIDKLKRLELLLESLKVEESKTTLNS